jgi:hypothetical protein
MVLWLDVSRSSKNRSIAFHDFFASLISIFPDESCDVGRNRPKIHGTFSTNTTITSQRVAVGQGGER